MEKVYYKRVANQRINGLYENPTLKQLVQEGMIQISREEYLKIKERFFGADIE